MGTSCTLNLVLKQRNASLSVSGQKNSREVPGHHRGMETCQGKFVRTNKQMNTVVRPPAECAAVPVHRDLMESFTAAFGGKAEVIGSGRYLAYRNPSKSTPQEVLALVSRRPCTLEDITAGLGLAPALEALRHR